MKLTAVVALALVLFGGSRAAAQGKQLVAPLWTGTPPGSEGKTGDEVVRVNAQGEHIVSHVHRPSITVYVPAQGRATGAGVIVIPGGGHREMWLDHEGYRVAEWLSAHGLAAFVLKYRLAREEGSTYTVEREELADVQRAIRLVRSRAAAWGVDPERIGVIGFSAGGQLAALAGTRFDSGRGGAPDAIERMSSRPAFMALMYPAVPRDMTLGKDTPPAFIMSGEGDNVINPEGMADLFVTLKRAGVPAELHLLAGVGHGFGIRATNPPAVAAWPTTFYNWLAALKVVPSGLP